MEQKPNKLSFLYDLNQENHIVSLHFNIHERTILCKCSCAKEIFCHHIDYILEYIYNKYNNDYVEDIELKIYQNEYNLWLPVSETNETTQEREIIDTEIQVFNQKFHFYCNHCGGINPVQKCRHFDYVIQALMEYYQGLKEQNDEINNMDLDMIDI